MKINRVDDLQVCERGNEDASLDVYETVEIVLSGIC